MCVYVCACAHACMLAIWRNSFGCYNSGDTPHLWYGKGGVVEYPPMSRLHLTVTALRKITCSASFRRPFGYSLHSMISHL